MNRSILMLPLLALAITGCRDSETAPEASETTQERVEQAVQEAQRSKATRDPETGTYVSTIPGDPAGTAVEADDDADSSNVRDARMARRDAESELIRARRACDDLPGTDRLACREHAEKAHADALDDRYDAQSDTTPADQ